MREPSDSLSNEPQDERALVVSFQAGDAEAYQAIYNRYAARVGAICRRMLLSPEDAAEASQETFLRVYVALPRFNGRYQLGAWVSRIATNVCLDMLRARGRAPARTLAAIDLEDLELEEPADDRNPESSYLRSSESRRVHDTLASLSPIHRAAIVLREFEGFSYAEIAITLGLSEQQIKALLHRARGTFKRSWVSALSSVLLPSRLWERLRGAPRPPRAHSLQSPTAQGQIGDLVASSANFVTSCSSALQHCGQFMSDRVAPLFVATAVGVMGGVAAASGPPPEIPPRVTLQMTTDSPVAEETPERRDRHRAIGDKKVQPEPEIEPEPVATPVEQAPDSPGPAPGSEGSEEQSKPDPEASPSAEPVAMMVALGFDRYGPVQSSSPSHHAMSLDCPARSLSQRLVTHLSDGPSRYPASLDLTVSGNVQLGFTLTKDDYQYEYRSWGAQPRVTWLEEDGSVSLRIEGEYGAVSGSEPSVSRLPDSGPFSLDIKVDCTTTAVVSESIVLGGN